MVGWELWGGASTVPPALGANLDDPHSWTDSSAEELASGSSDEEPNEALALSGAAAGQHEARAHRAQRLGLHGLVDHEVAGAGHGDCARCGPCSASWSTSNRVREQGTRAPRAARRRAGRAARAASHLSAGLRDTELGRLLLAAVCADLAHGHLDGRARGGRARAR